MGDESKTGRRIAKLRNKKARSQRKSRLKHQGKTTAPAGEGNAPPDKLLLVDAEANDSSEGPSEDFPEDSFDDYDDDDSEESDSEDDERGGAAR